MSTTKVFTSIIIFLLFYLTACAQHQPAATLANSSSAKQATLKPGWNQIKTGGNTICSDGSPYHFFVHPGISDKLVVYLQGGGACWSGTTCDPDLKPTYKINLEKVNPEVYNGILDFNNPENPIQHHTVIFAPYCTADVHMGKAIIEYQAPAIEGHPGHSFKIQHKGYLNIDAVLKWTYSHYRKPKQIFVAGSSAGSIPSPYYAMLIAARYPEARLAQLGDGSGSYRLDGNAGTPPQAQWGTLKRLQQQAGFTDLTINNFGYDDLYIRAAQNQPNIQFAQYDAAEDSVQKFFLSLITEQPASLLILINKNQASIRNSISNFHSYIAGGELHTVLLRPEFYTYKVDDLRVRDWVKQLVDGQKLSVVFH